MRCCQPCAATALNTAVNWRRVSSSTCACSRVGCNLIRIVRCIAHVFFHIFVVFATPKEGRAILLPPKGGGPLAYFYGVTHHASPDGVVCRCQPMTSSATRLSRSTPASIS